MQVIEEAGRLAIPMLKRPKPSGVTNRGFCDEFSSFTLTSIQLRSSRKSIFPSGYRPRKLASASPLSPSITALVNAPFPHAGFSFAFSSDPEAPKNNSPSTGCWAIKSFGLAPPARQVSTNSRIGPRAELLPRSDNLVRIKSHSGLSSAGSSLSPWFWSKK